MDIGTLSRRSCANADLFRNICRENTISTSSHFPQSAQRSWRLWWMRGHLPRREVRLDAGMGWQPDVICLMLCRYCFNNDRVSFCRIFLQQKKKVPVQQSHLGNTWMSSKGKIASCNKSILKLARQRHGSLDRDKNKSKTVSPQHWPHSWDTAQTSPDEKWYWGKSSCYTAAHKSPRDETRLISLKVYDLKFDVTGETNRRQRTNGCSSWSWLFTFIYF